MKLLLTSNGLSNPTIADALETLVGKPREDIKIAFVPTAGFSRDDAKYETRDWLVNDLYRTKEFAGYIDIVSLADLSPAEVLKRLEYVDVIFVGGGNAFYLSYWMEKSGLFDALPKLLESRVYVGISAGSMIATKSIRTASQAIKDPSKFYDEMYDMLGPNGRSGGKTAQLVDFVVRPHLNQVRFEGNQDDIFKAIVKDVQAPLYAIDDMSAILVDGSKVEVITEGKWKLYEQ